MALMPSAAHRLRRSVAPALLAGLGLVLLTTLCAHLRLGLAPSAFLCLLLLVLVSPALGTAAWLALALLGGVSLLVVAGRARAGVL
jgi:hypothetical protein